MGTAFAGLAIRVVSLINMKCYAAIIKDGLADWVESRRVTATLLDSTQKLSRRIPA